jgi:hypothetical protein
MECQHLAIPLDRQTALLEGRFVAQIVLKLRLFPYKDEFYIEQMTRRLNWRI